MRIIFVAVAESSGISTESLGLGASKHREAQFQKQKSMTVGALLEEGLMPRRGLLKKLFKQPALDLAVYCPQSDTYSKGRIKDVAELLAKKAGGDQQNVVERHGLNSRRNNPFVLEDVASVSEQVETVICVASIEAVRENLSAIADGFKVDEYIDLAAVEHGDAAVVDLFLPGNLKWVSIPSVARGDGGGEDIEARARQKAINKHAAALAAAKTDEDKALLPDAPFSDADIQCTAHGRIVKCLSPRLDR